MGQVTSKKNFVILGMHRSATSLITKSLVDMGWYFSGEIGSDIHNPHGYYEDSDILTINDIILEEANGSWYEPPTEKAIKSISNKFQSAVSYIMEQKYSEDGWVIKDPRLCLTFPVWEKVFEGSILIFIKRDKEEVLESLLRRNSPGISSKQLRKIIDIYNDRLTKIWIRQL